MHTSHLRRWKRSPGCAWLSQLRADRAWPVWRWQSLSNMLRKCCCEKDACTGTAKRTSSSPDTPLRTRTLTTSAAPMAAAAGGASSGLCTAPPQKGDGAAEVVAEGGIEGATLAEIEKSSRDVQEPIQGEAAQHLGVKLPLASAGPPKSSSACERGFLTAASRHGEAFSSPGVATSLGALKASAGPRGSWPSAWRPGDSSRRPLEAGAAEASGRFLPHLRQKTESSRKTLPQAQALAS
mmetsp:Transcript_37989/g.120758  ORF Transcript_37989/g.120758 Transcript_37989/m.120758 type:complete len:238 (-) Transcript_37989:1379-2092(-)